MNLFDELTLSATEEEVVIATLSQPAVRKYFQGIANGIGNGIIAFATQEKQGAIPDTIYMRMVNKEQGKLDIIKTILDFTKKEVPKI